MRVLERLSFVPEARTRMSEETRVLLVERFDADAQVVVAHGARMLAASRRWTKKRPKHKVFGLFSIIYGRWWMSMDKKSGAGNESRTRDLNLGKVALYQLSYSRIFTALSRCWHRRWALRFPKKARII